MRIDTAVDFRLVRNGLWRLPDNRASAISKDALARIEARLVKIQRERDAAVDALALHASDQYREALDRLALEEEP